MWLSLERGGFNSVEGSRCVLKVLMRIDFSLKSRLKQLCYLFMPYAGRYVLVVMSAVFALMLVILLRNILVHTCLKYTVCILIS